jgi:hypothetical protein
MNHLLEASSIFVKKGENIVKIFQNKRWSTLALIVVCLAVVATTSIYVIMSSYNLKAFSNQSSPKIESGNEQNAESEKTAITGSKNTTANNVASVPIASSVTPKPENSSNQPSTAYKEFFKDDAFLGDSISEGLSFYDFLDENSVVAEKGLNITKGIDESDKVIALKPKRVFILFGVNDSDDRTPSSWLVDQYTKLVVKLKTKLPNSKIYVTSILPVLEKTVNNPHINNAHINECNSGLKNMAIQQNVNYVNLASLLNESNTNLYENDGIHFKSDFYNMWLNYLENSITK